jgi:exosortase A
VATTGQKRWLLLLSLPVTTALFSFHHTLFLMVGTWYHSRTFSHCLLIVPMFAYLVWIRRERFADLQPQPEYWALAAVGTFVLVWILGNLGEVRFLQEFAVVAIVVAVAWALLGSAILRALALPILFLLFAVPFGTGLIPPLQDFTSWFVIHALTLSHVPAVLEKHTIWLPAGVWTVAETCSGIRFLLSSFVLGIFFSLVMYRSWQRRVAFLAASVIVPIIGNGFRAYGTIFLAYSTNNKVAAGVDHIVYGGLFAIFIQLILIGIGLRWREYPSLTEQMTENPSTAVVSAIGQRRFPDKRALMLATGLAALIFFTPIIAAYLRNHSGATMQWENPPVMVTEPWQTTATGDMSWAPLWHGRNIEYGKSYEHQLERVDLHWVLYSGQDEIDLFAPSEAIESAQSWAVVKQDLRTVKIGAKNIPVFQNLIQSGKTSRTVWTWYWIGGENTADRARVRFLQAKARLLGEPAEVAVISVGVDRPGDTSDEFILQEFLDHTNFEINPAPVPSASLHPPGVLIQH